MLTFIYSNIYNMYTPLTGTPIRIGMGPKRVGTLALWHFGVVDLFCRYWLFLVALPWAIGGTTTAPDGNNDNNRICRVWF